MAAMRIPGAETPAELSSSIECLKQTILAELQTRLFYGVDPFCARYFENPELFGTEVFYAFPSANEDICEAGNCLALERGTACVMHMQRAMEAALKVLAKDLGIEQQKDLGGYLRRIEEELESRFKKARARTVEEQFYSEARVTFDAVRRAWRNPSMHVGENYSPDRAEEILISVRAFMRHLATKLRE
jgi:HEPN domain-containing protein